MRRREDQIARAAFALGSGAAIRAALVGTDVPAGGDAPSASQDVEQIVCETFARALRLTPERVKAIDALEPMGCDSLRIVEITVALSE